VSACGVCVSGYSGGNECVGYRCVVVKAGKGWICSECGKPIEKGEKYELASWFYADGDGAGNAKTCLICAEIAEAFQCGGRWHASSFWEDMEPAWDKLTTACFDRLRTVEAKTELRRRWMEYKGLLPKAEVAQ
jgi:hypothetical protein